MVGEEKSPNTPLTHGQEILPAFSRAAFDAQLEEFAATIQLPPQLVAALKPESLAVHSIGLPSYDTRGSNGDSRLIQRTTEISLNNYTDFYKGSSYERAIGPTYTRRQRRYLQANQGGPSLRREVFELEAHKNWEANIAQSVDEGLARSPLLSSLIFHFYVNYFAESESEDTAIDFSISELQPDDLQGIFEPTELAAGITVGQLATRLREHGKTDLSKATLDARYANFMAVAQVELTKMFINDVYILGVSLGGTKGQRAKAVALMDKYAPDFGTDNIGVKGNMIAELSHTFEQFIGLDPKLDRSLHLLAQRSSGALSHMVNMLDVFTKIYSNLNYDLPPFLQERLVALEQATTVTPIAMDSITEVDPVTTQKIQEAQAYDNLLGQWAEGFVAYWSASAREKRRYTELQRQFVVGFRNDAGQQILNGMTKVAAQQWIGVLAKISGLAQYKNLSEAQQLLHMATSAQQQYEHEVRILYEFCEHDVGAYQPRNRELIDVTSRVTQLRDEWIGFRQLLIKAWPDHQGTQAAERIERLLFAAPENLVNTHGSDDTQEPEPIATPDIQADVLPEAKLLTNFEKSIAEQLDEIILPPDITSIDIEQTLRHLGTDKATMTTVQWQRLQDLVQLRQQNNGRLYRSKEGSLGNAPPYYVAVFEFEGETYAVAESPVFGNATYVVAEKHAAGTWLEVLELSKRDARQVGARRIIHSELAPYGEEHLKKIYDKIVDLHFTSGF